MFKILNIILIILTYIDYINCLTPKGATTIDELRNRYFQIEEESWNYVENNITKQQILQEIFTAHSIFSKINLGIDYQENEFVTLNHMYEWKYIEKDLILVNNLFVEFRRNLNMQLTDGFEELQSTDLAETILYDERFPVNDTFEQIDNIMVKQGLYYKAMLETNSYVCNAHQSPQQVLLQLYNAISVTELKGYAMMQFAWMLLKTYNRGNYTGEAKLMRKRFQDRTEKTQEVLRNVLQRSDRTVWRCDPNHHVQDETYVQLTRLLQGYIENEVDLNGDETCKETCNFYQYTESHGCFKNKFCARQQKCHGKILSCQFVDSDMWICPSQQNGNSTRRYDYIEYENGRILGKKGSCSRGTDKVDSWWRYLFWHCSYCFCLCDEQGAKSDRYFNLREVVSNTTANKIVTGLRFIKKNRIVYLQIQEGELIMRGNINTGTVEWKAIDIFDIRTRGIRNGVDYHTMAWDKRAIDLDDLIAEAGHVVTGVRFRVVGTHLNLEIRVTEMDFVNGKLIDPEHTSVWISNDNTDTSKDKRTQIHLYKPDVPTNNRGRSQIDSKTNQYIEFTNTDINEDAAQSTVPFIDAQDVISEPPVPLSGVGIYHKGTNNYGGFVAPKLFTYDFTPHIYTPKEDEE